MHDSKGENFMTKIHSERTSIPLTKDELTKIKVRAIRRGVWFRVLSRGERAQVELTMRIVKRIRSFFLAKVLTRIVEKLLDAMESKVARLMREVGPALVQKLIEIAQKWGNESAVNWTADPRFSQYLTVMYVNTPSVFKT